MIYFLTIVYVKKMWIYKYMCGVILVVFFETYLYTYIRGGKNENN